MTPNVEEAVKNAKAGQVRYRTDKNGIIHAAIGKVGFAPDASRPILMHFGDLKKAKPASAAFISRKYLCRQQWALFKSISLD